MITVLHWQGNAIVSSVIGAADAIPEGTVWVDIISPTEDEEKSLERQLKVEIPTREETWKNHVLNRLYTEDGISYMTAAIITKLDTPYPQTSSVTFILSAHHLITLRQIAPTSFKTFAQRLLRYPHRFTNGAEVLEGLLEEVITRVAHNSEVVVDELDTISHQIFDPHALEQCKQSPSVLMQDVLRRLGACADLNSKISESLHSLSRMLSFFREVKEIQPEIVSATNVLMADVTALSRQTAFLSDKVNFQLDATLGMINVEQNMIIKIFSVVAVFFLPPTLVSSIYGMNFAHMPELQWVTGYPMAIGMMIMCGLIPFAYFRKRGWL